MPPSVAAVGYEFDSDGGGYSIRANEVKREATEELHPRRPTEGARPSRGANSGPPAAARDAARDEGRATHGTLGTPAGIRGVDAESHFRFG
jgi:hypothetical protein